MPRSHKKPSKSRIKFLLRQGFILMPRALLRIDPSHPGRISVRNLIEALIIANANFAQGDDLDAGDWDIKREHLAQALGPPLRTLDRALADMRADRSLQTAKGQHDQVLTYTPYEITQHSGPFRKVAKSARGKAGGKAGGKAEKSQSPRPPDQSQLRDTHRGKADGKAGGKAEGTIGVLNKKTRETRPSVCTDFSSRSSKKKKKTRPPPPARRRRASTQLSPPLENWLKTDLPRLLRKGGYSPDVNGFRPVDFRDALWHLVHNFNKTDNTLTDVLTWFLSSDSRAAAWRRSRTPSAKHLYEGTEPGEQTWFDKIAIVYRSEAHR